MLCFKRVDSKVRVEVETGLLNRYYCHEIDFNSELIAELVRQQYQKHMEATLKFIREEAYNDGWRDAKAKKAKRSIFKCWW